MASGRGFLSAAARFRSRESGTLAGLVALCAVFSVWSPYFLTASNLVNVVQQSVIIGIVAAGMTFVVISRGIDLSVGSIVAFSGLLTAEALHAGVPIALAIAIGLAVGLAIGFINGVLIAYAGLPPFIVTLGMMSVARGAALVYANGGSISGFAEGFRAIAQGSFLALPIPVVVMTGVYALGALVLSRTRFGRHTYAIGGNEEAAILAGIDVRRAKTAVYGLCGLTSGMAAVLLTARINSAQSVAGTLYELDAIAATVIGGSSLMGGVGTLYGTLLGALLMSVLRNGLNLLDVSSYLQQIAIGSVIVVAVLVDVVMKKRRARA
jgi:ribose transport system permease protein